MNFGWTRRQKPPIGTPLDRAHELIDGLVWYAPFWEGGGQTMADIVGGVNLTRSSSSVIWTPGSSALTGGGAAAQRVVAVCRGDDPRSSANPGAHHARHGCQVDRYANQQLLDLRAVPQQYWFASIRLGVDSAVVIDGSRDVRLR